ncbi:MAG: nicotinate-nucleotide adenylyltransferase [Chloroflexota bacterium]|nr:nicotinate-nucleotide adenylyltransferase [Chloroflexota bacterium]
MKVGVIGGTFDPIHNGHIGIAKVARRELGLSRVLFVPANKPWLKGLRDIAPGHHRIAMIDLAISLFPYFDVSYVDMEREGPSYTVDTLTDLSREFAVSAELYFIIGMDAMANLPQWKEPGRVIEMCRLVVARRPGSQALDIDEMERRLSGISRRVIIIDNDLFDINSTDIRKRVASGLRIDGLVPDAVARYIAEHGLYKKEV